MPYKQICVTTEITTNSSEQLTRIINGKTVVNLEFLVSPEVT